MAAMMGDLLKNDLKKLLTKTYPSDFSDMLVCAEKYARMKEAFVEETHASSIAPYFQAHIVMLLTNQQIKAVLHHLDTSKRISKWALELAELDVHYHLRPAIKAQVLADFILECTIPNKQSSQDGVGSKPVECLEAGKNSKGEETDIGSDPEELWMLHVLGNHVDSLSNASGVGVRLILTDPEGDVTRYTLRFKFQATNNEVEYETLLAGLKVTREAGPQHLKVFCDSQLVVGHIKDRYEAREENMKKYLQKVKDLTSVFLSFDIQQVPRADNARADALSKLAVLLPTDLENGTYFEVLKVSTLEEPLIVQQVDEEPCWIDPLLKYFRSGKLSTDRKEACKIRK
ncbi:uncharacterized protein [Elaeis guineensis]|uniref:uncharacterized protein n=1 Tax=Elaeis guineensis var. tenera TaxID=51953 RepID=UPI003C6D017D